MRFDRHSTESIGGVVVFLTVGLGLTLLFFGVDWFWVVFVLGFAVVLPLVGVLTSADEEAESETEKTADPLETLRDRYARGEIDEAGFERRLDRLLETESPEDFSERLADDERLGHERDRESATERS
ncbi:MAG: SHOCT domain-containing protein [Halobacteriales archaeon]